MADQPSVQPAQPIQQLIAAVKKEVGAVAKNEKNPQQGFNFRGVDSVVNAAAPALNRYEVVIVPEVIEFTYETIEIGRNKTQMGHVTGKVAYWFYGPLGDFMKTVVPSEAMDNGDKAIPKFMSVAYRIALLQVLNLPTDEPDPDSETFERSVKTPENTKTADNTKTAEIPKTPNSPNFAESVQNAKTAAQLNKVWKDAGAAGALDSTLVTSDGDVITLRTLLYRRNDELGLKKSPDPAETPAGTRGGNTR